MSILQKTLKLGNFIPQNCSEPPQGPVIRQQFLLTCLAALLHCKLKPVVAHITTCASNLSRNMLREVVLLPATNFNFFTRITTHAGHNLHRNKFKFNACDWLSVQRSYVQISENKYDGLRRGGQAIT